MTTPDEQRETSVGEELVRGLTELRDALRDGESLPERFTMRTVELELRPQEFTADDIKAIREDTLRASQAIFAVLLGVDTTTLQSWEQGRQEPPAWACRLLDLMKDDPERWHKMLADGARRKQAHSDCC
jgi:putative transcriptional regulator